MAKLTGNIGFTGRLGNMSAYKMRGSDGIILRGKGGASKSRIKNHPNFELTRHNNAEFGGSSVAGKSIRIAINAVTHLADHNISGNLNAIARIILGLDAINKRGERAIRFSQYHHLLDGFSLNRQSLFNSVLRQQVSYTFFRDTGSANIILPELLPGINFYTPSRYSSYRFIISLGVIHDLVYNKTGYQPEGPKNYTAKTFDTEWASTREARAEQSMDIQLYDFTVLRNNQSLVLSIGIEYGQPLSNNVVTPIKQSGCAVILATG